MYLFEAHMSASQSLHRVSVSRRDGVDQVEPVAELGLDQGEGRRAHPSGEGVDVVPTEAAGRLLGRRVGVRAHAPDRLHRHPVDVTDLSECQQLLGLVQRRLQSLAVHPPGGIGVPLHLHVLGELAVADGAALQEQLLHLPQDERVALDRRRVVGLVDPELVPDRASLGRCGQSPEPFADLGNRGVQPLVEL